MTCGFRIAAGESAVSGAVDLEFRREEKKKRTEKTSGTDSNAARRSVDRKASATPNGNVPVSGAGGRRERRCRRGAP